jgi:hypothetical protein
MKNCKYYEVDAVAKAESDAEWDAMPQSMKDELQRFEDEHTPEVLESMGYEKTPFDDLPCYEFCKNLCQGAGYPGETITYCSHPEVKLVHCDSVFEGLSYGESLRVLDAVC